MQKLSRRKLLKGTVKTAPLLALASSKSVWASSCMSMSGSLSNNFSNKVTYECKGSEGCSVDVWKNKVHFWPKSVFPGIFLFSNKSFNIKWDWTKGKSSYLKGDRKYFGWNKKTLSDVANSDNYGSYAKTWSQLLGGMRPQGISCETPWESLSQTYSSGSSEAEQHLAAAYLNAVHPGIEYGYSALQLIDFCNRAESNKDQKIFNRFIDSLASLNERGVLDESKLQTYARSDLSKCYDPNKSSSSRYQGFSSYSAKSSSSSSSNSIDTAGIIGDPSDYPSLS